MNSFLLYKYLLLYILLKYKKYTHTQVSTNVQCIQEKMYRNDEVMDLFDLIVWIVKYLFSICLHVQYFRC